MIHLCCLKEAFNLRKIHKWTRVSSNLIEHSVFDRVFSSPAIVPVTFCPSSSFLYLFSRIVACTMHAVKEIVLNTANLMVKLSILMPVASPQLISEVPILLLMAQETKNAFIKNSSFNFRYSVKHDIYHTPSKYSSHWHYHLLTLFVS